MSENIPETMRAAVYYRRRDLRVEERPVPSPGPEDVLIAVDYCGVCGTDLHLVMDGWGRPKSINGHEFSGTIVALGHRVEGWSIGELVVGGPQPGCGSCEYCRDHRPMLCDAQTTPGVSEYQGAFADYVRVKSSHLLRVPDGLTSREAALAEPLAVALHGITRSTIAPGQRALVTGAGPIGMLTLAALLARGVEDVTVSEPAESRRELASRLGAAKTLVPEDIPIPAMPFQTADAPFHAAFECSGRAAAVEAALGQLRKGGTLVIQGTGADRASLDGHRILLNELVITGAYCYDENGMSDALALLASGTLANALLLHPEDVGLASLRDGLERLSEGRIGGKLLVNPRLDSE